MSDYYKNKFHNAMDIVKSLRSKTMETKKWYQSKALQGAILVFVSGGLRALGYEEIGNLLMAVGTAFGIYGIRVADTKIQ